MLLFQAIFHPVDINAHKRKAGDQGIGNRIDIEPRLFIVGLFLDDLNRFANALVIHRITELHDKLIGTASEVGIVDREELSRFARGRSLFKAFEMIADCWIDQGISVDIAIDRHLFGGVWDMEDALFIRVDPRAVSLDIRDTELDVSDIFKRRFRVDLGNTGPSRNIEDAIIREFTVGVGCRDAWKTIGDRIVDSLDRSAI